MDDAAKIILQRQSAMERDRAPFDQAWDDLARYILPRQAFMLGSSALAGAMGRQPRQSSRVFDETAQLAHERGVAIFLGYVMPRGARWQVMTPRDDALLKYQHVRAWYERKTAQLFALRSNAQSGFDTQTHESAASLLAFGGQGMWPEIRYDRRGRPLGVFYRSEHVGGVWVQENAWGVVDIAHRKFALSARQADQKWGAKAPEEVKRLIRDNQPEERIWFLHAIEPNPAHDDRRIDADAMPIRSRYLEMAKGEIFDTGGYRTMPLIYSRFDKAPGETFGRSPGMTVLPAVRQCQVMVRNLVTAAELAAKPPLLAGDDALDRVIRYVAGGVTYGGLDEQGNQLIRPMLQGVDLQPAREMLNETRAIIAQAFFNDLMLGDPEGLKSHVTDAQLMDRNQDKGVLLAPLGRQETEWFDPMVAREVDLMDELGLLEDMPPEVIEAGAAYQLRYENPLARAQRSEQVAGYFKLLNAVAPLAQADPGVLAELKRMYPMKRVLPVLADVLAVPASMAATEAELMKAEAKDAQDQQTQQLLQGAPIAAGVAKDLAGVEAMGNA